MQFDGLAEAIDQLVESTSLADDGNLEAFAHVPSTIATDHGMHRFSRRRVPVGGVACSRLGNRTPLLSWAGSTVPATDFVHATRNSPEVVQTVSVVSRCVDTATTHDVCEHGPCVEMRECQNDIVWSKTPASSPAADPAYRLENLVVDRHEPNIHL
jgi:hypothetical protein